MEGTSTMADSTLPRNLGRPGRITISKNMQAHYARRGLWVGGEPIGVLRDMLGRRVDFERPAAAAVFRVSPDQCEALARDIAAQPVYTSFGNLAQRTQFLRRLREAAGMPSGVGAACRSSPAPSTVVPFELNRPLGGKAEKAFAEHVMRTVREFVDYTQSGDFEQGAA
jgi:hypothetical protein